MYNGLSIYQTKHCKTMFLALPCLTFVIFNCPVVSKKQYYHIKNCNKLVIITELQQNMQKHINVCCCSFNKISIKRKKLCCKKRLTQR